MKRNSPNDVNMDYHNALRRVNLVERTSTPNGLQLVNSFRAGRHESEDIVALATQIKEADLVVRNTACNKLQLILDQIKFLQGQAEKILKQTEVNEQLNHAACNFKKNPGTIYHLYERESGQTYFSMLSLEDWGPSFKHRFLGSYRLETDHSWTPVEELEKRNEELKWAERLLDSKNKDRTGNLLSIQDKDNKM